MKWDKIDEKIKDSSRVYVLDATLATLFIVLCASSICFLYGAVTARLDGNAEMSWLMLCPGVVSTFLLFLVCRFPKFVEKKAGKIYQKTKEDENEEIELKIQNRYAKIGHFIMTDHRMSQKKKNKILDELEAINVMKDREKCKDELTLLLHRIGR